MTVIASFKINNIPYIIGDLLISGYGIPGLSVHLPTAGNVAEWYQKGKRLYPSGMMRKVCVINNIAFGWAGNARITKEIINDIRQKISTHAPISMDRLEDLFSTLPSSLKKNMDEGKVSFTGYLLDPQEDKKQHFSINSTSINYSLLQNLHISGSGTEIFLKNLSLINENANYSVNDASQNQETAWNDAVQKVLTISGRLFQVV